MTAGSRPERERDPFTAAHWNGHVRVVIHPPARGLPAVPALSRDFLGREIVPLAWAELVGAPDGAEVSVAPELSDLGIGVRIRVEHPWFDGAALRSLYRDEEGRVAILNEFLVIRPDAPDGVGVRMLAHQVRKAVAIGVAYLAMEAAGGPGSPFVGYSVWPRLGFDGPIPLAARRKLAALPEGHPLRGATRVLDLVSRPGGREWWRANGSSFPAIFDLRENSASRLTLEAYTRQKGIVL